MRQVKRNSNTRNAVGRTPLVGQVEVRPEVLEPRLGELFFHLPDGLLEPSTLELDAKIAQAQVQELFFGEPIEAAHARHLAGV